MTATPARGWDSSESVRALIVAGAVQVAEGGSRLVGYGLAIVGVLGLSAVMLVGRAASATFAAILYRYATDGDVPATIPRDELENLGQPVATAV